MVQYCTCEKHRCGPRGPRGTFLPRTTWYNHNSRGKTAKLPEPSQEQITTILALPTPTYSKRWKRRLETEGVAGPYPAIPTRTWLDRKVRGGASGENVYGIFT
jgi:hypothetical protein